MPSLVVQTSFLGDMVLTTPLIAHLARAGPVDVLATKAGATLLANNPAVREIIVYDKRGADRGVGGFRRIASRLRARTYDSAYLAQGSVRSGALTLAAGIRERVGFASSAGRLFYTTRIPPIEGTHHAAKLLSLATRDPLAEAPRAQIRPHLYPGMIERAQVDEVLGPSSAGAQLVALAPGSVWATKRWPYFAELAHELSALGQVVVVGGAADRELAREIVGATKGQAIDATGRLPLLASAELIGRSALLVTNDSAPLHLASAMNTPTVAVFGPTVPEFGFGPLAERAAVAGNDALTCRPCDRHGPQRCPLGHWRCMREITPDVVARMARELL
ncbi:MAG: glycosyl transferase family 9 [Gemmatimonadetes bacterium]|nr:glycosyl transferase family 9 [Gemmatimonadota bacterium]